MEYGTTVQYCAAPSRSKMDMLHEEIPHPHLDNAEDPLHPHKRVDMPTESLEAPRRRWWRPKTWRRLNIYSQSL